MALGTSSDSTAIVGITYCLWQRVQQVVPRHAFRLPYNPAPCIRPHPCAVCPAAALLLLSGKGLDLVRMFYSLLPQRHRWVEAQTQAPEVRGCRNAGVSGQAHAAQG